MLHYPPVIGPKVIVTVQSQKIVELLTGLSRLIGPLTAFPVSHPTKTVERTTDTLSAVQS
ncbi:hypothetical protein KKG41_01160 [Patescibacteria group bacterium]|nr:hypothetical protein [Patescibacteria group bacterium]MBU1891101.1 hypothetical protein [Patescibacteria group bacterium]